MQTQEGAQLYYKLSSSNILRPLLRNPIVALLIHWIFQGMLYMESTERAFKVGLDIIGFLSLTLIMHVTSRQPLRLVMLVAAVMAHSLNFIFNGQLWIVMKHFHLVNHSRSEFLGYLEKMTERIQDESSLEFAAVYGSVVRDEWHTSSDLDVRLVRRKGMSNAARACTFVMKERTRAFLCRFPLDIYVLDNYKRLHLMRSDEKPLILLPCKQASK